MQHSQAAELVVITLKNGDEDNNLLEITLFGFNLYKVPYVSKLNIEKAQLTLIMVMIITHNHENIRSWAMSHNHTILGQMPEIFSRFDFKKAVNETQTEYHARCFRPWKHFVAMLFGQLYGQDNLRGIEAGLASKGKSLSHL